MPQDYWEGGHRIPGVIEYPPLIKSNVRSEHTLVTTDLLPTIMDLLNVKRPPSQAGWGLDGRSAVPAMRGEPAESFNEFGRGWLFWRQSSALGGAFRYGDWKFVNQSHSCTNATCDAALYNLKDDLGETNDLSASHPEIFSAIALNMSRWKWSVINSALKESECVDPFPPGPEPDHPTRPPAAPPLASKSDDEAPLNIAHAEYLTEYPLAKCLDGTPAYYYIRNATSSANASKWVIHIQGGGWCSTPDSCASRAGTNLGSSAHAKTHEADVQDLNLVHGCQNNRWCGALMVNDPVTNPLAHDWNAVLLRYCDGASWIGSVQDAVEHKGQQLFFRGKYNLEAVFASLVKKHSLGQATEVLIGGDSAGGLATFLHIDTMTDYIHAANAAAGVAGADVLGMPDSGFWPDDTHEGFSGDFLGMWKMQAGDAPGLPKHCKWAPSNASRCLFPQYFAGEITTRLFPLQSIYDPLQKGAHPQTHGEWLLAELNRTVLSTKRSPPNGAWIHSCERHCGAELLTIDGSTVPEMLPRFLKAKTAADQTLWLQEAKYPCSTCCNDGAPDTE